MDSLGQYPFLDTYLLPLLDKCNLFQIWLDCAALETTLSHFRGLREALNQHSRDWQEYFQCSVDLMNPLPGEWITNFSAFEKVLLWRICAPNRVCTNISVECWKQCILFLIDKQTPTKFYLLVMLYLVNYHYFKFSDIFDPWCYLCLQGASLYRL